MANPAIAAPGSLADLSETTERLEAFVPNLIAAGTLILVGLVLAWLARWIGVRLLQLWSERLAGGVAALAGTNFGTQLGRTRPDETTLRIFGRTIFALVLLVFFAAAMEALELPVISRWVLSLANYLPQILTASLVIVVGVLAGGFARAAVIQVASSADIEYATAYGRLVQAAIIAVAAVVAVDQLGLQVGFLVIAVSIALAASLGAAALAFGLGAQTSVKNILATHYLAQTYEVGHRVRVAGHEGLIAAITPTAVVLETAAGRVSIPSQAFAEESSTLVAGDPS